METRPTFKRLCSREKHEAEPHGRLWGSLKLAPCRVGRATPGPAAPVTRGSDAGSGAVGWARGAQTPQAAGHHVLADSDKYLSRGKSQTGTTFLPNGPTSRQTRRTAQDPSRPRQDRGAGCRSGPRRREHGPHPLPQAQPSSGATDAACVIFSPKAESYL